MSDLSPSSSGEPNNWDEILTLARTYQYDRYLAATLSPRSARADLIVLAAFAGEMRRIPWTVSDPTIGMIRLQWWRDCLTAGAQTTSGNPLADTLNEIVVRRKLPPGLLIGHIDAQELELYADLVEDMDQLRLHFIKRESGLFQLAALILGRGDSIPEIDRGACAYGLAKSIAEFAFRQNGRQLLVPGDLASTHGVEPGKLLAGEADGAVPSRAHALLAELSVTAISDYQVFRDALGSNAKKVFGAILPVTLTPSYARTAKSPFDAANISNMGPGNFAKSCQMLLAYLRGKI